MLRLPEQQLVAETPKLQIASNLVVFTSVGFTKSARTHIRDAYAIC
jgi:hypothetical protein